MSLGREQFLRRDRWGSIGFVPLEKHEKALFLAAALCTSLGSSTGKFKSLCNHEASWVSLRQSPSLSLFRVVVRTEEGEEPCILP